MARGTPATQVIGSGGLVVALTAAPADGDIVDMSGAGTFVEVANGSGGSINVTILNPQEYNGLDVADRVVAVAAGTTAKIPVPAFFKQDVGTMDAGIDVGGKALINYSAVATVTRGVARFGV